MAMNQFASQQEVIFITYDDVIKSSKLYILKTLLNDIEYKKCYKDFINYSKIENKDDQQLNAIISASTKSNILEFLATKEFDYNVTYDDLVSRFDDIYEKSDLLEIGKSIYVLLQQKFTKKIFIYTKDYDKRLHKNITDLFDMESIVYINGEFEDVINDIFSTDTITSYILNDINLLQKLIDMDKVKFTSVLIANYGYNYTLNDDLIPILKIDNIDNISKEKVFKLGVFQPIADTKF